MDPQDVKRRLEIIGDIHDAPDVAAEHDRYLTEIYKAGDFRGDIGQRPQSGAPTRPT